MVETMQVEKILGDAANPQPSELKASFAPHLLGKHLSTLLTIATTNGAARPLLAHVMVEAVKQGSAGVLRLSATDLSVTMRIEIPAAVEEPGRALMPADLFCSAINALPSDRAIGLDVIKNGAMRVKSGSSRLRIAGLDPDKFPQLPADKEDDDWRASIVPASIARLLRRTEPVANGKSSYSSLRALLLRFTSVGSDKQLEGVSTDSHRIVWATELGGWSPHGDSSDRDMLLSVAGADLVERVSASCPPGHSVRCGTVDDGHIRFEMNAMASEDPFCVVVWARRPESIFPSCLEVAQNCRPKFRLAMGRATLADSMKLCRIVESERGSAVSLNFDKAANRLLMSLANPDLGTTRDAVLCMPCGENATENGVHANAKYIDDALTATEADAVELSWQAQAITVRPASGSSKDNDVVTVIAPVFKQEVQ